METAFNFPLIAARVVHFASTIALAGIFLFLSFVAEPAFSNHGEVAQPALSAYRRRLLAIAWWSMGLSVVSAGAWFLLLSAQISESSVAAALSDGTAQTLLTRTQFGRDWEIRLGLSVALGFAILAFARRPAARAFSNSAAAAILAACLLGTLAWAGHAGATPGLKGHVQLTADVLHLVAAGAWIGTLLPLALLLSRAQPASGFGSFSIARDATLRFSTLGVAAVATLAITGLINTWALVGNLPDLVGTVYGRILLLKIAIFLSMVALAGVNRFRLTPHLGDGPASADAVRRLKRNCLIEAALGCAVLVLVGALGTLAPGMQMAGS